MDIAESRKLSHETRETSVPQLRAGIEATSIPAFAKELQTLMPVQPLPKEERRCRFCSSIILALALFFWERRCCRSADARKQMCEMYARTLGSMDGEI